MKLETFDTHHELKFETEADFANWLNRRQPPVVKRAGVVPVVCAALLGAAGAYLGFNPVHEADLKRAVETSRAAGLAQGRALGETAGETRGRIAQSEQAKLEADQAYQRGIADKAREMTARMDRLRGEANTKIAMAKAEVQRVIGEGNGKITTLNGRVKHLREVIDCYRTAKTEVSFMSRDAIYKRVSGNLERCNRL